MSTSTRRYESAMQRALKKARFLPAEIDGVPVPVYFSFQVVFEDKDGCVATAFPNLGYRTSELGAGYVAPQELMTDGGWTKRMRFFESITFPSPGVFFSMSVMVDENCTATDRRVEYTNPVSPSRITPSAPDMAASAAKALEASKFIPGFHQGVPVPMRYLENTLRRVGVTVLSVFFAFSTPSNPISFVAAAVAHGRSC